MIHGFNKILSLILQILAIKNQNRLLKKARKKIQKNKIMKKKSQNLQQFKNLQLCLKYQCLITLLVVLKIIINQ